MRNAYFKAFICSIYSFTVISVFQPNSFSTLLVSTIESIQFLLRISILFSALTKTVFHVHTQLCRPVELCASIARKIEVIAKPLIVFDCFCNDVHDFFPDLEISFQERDKIFTVIWIYPYAIL